MEQLIQLKKRLTEKGYIEILKNKWILEHRLIMEMYIGRELKPEEKVHHIDFDKKNNKIENLMLFKNQKEHQKFHRQIKQFGHTQPRRTELKILKENMKKEREKNLVEVK